MKKKHWGIIGVTVLCLVSLSCYKYSFYADISVVNVGDFPIRAYVNDDMGIIEPGDTLTWELNWEGDNLLEVYLYAEPVGFYDFDEETILIRDGENYTWVVGWELLAGKTRKACRKQGGIK